VGRDTLLANDGTNGGLTRGRNHRGGENQQRGKAEDKDLAIQENSNSPSMG